MLRFVAQHFVSLVLIATSFFACGAKRDTPKPNPQNSGVLNQYVSFPDVGMKLIRPDGFVEAKNFNGFQQPNTQSSVMALMIPGPFSETTGGFTVEEMKTCGMNLRSKENVEIDGMSGVLLNITQSAYGTEFTKWIVAFGNDAETRMVTAMFPKSREAELSIQLKSVVLSAKLDETAPNNSRR